MEILAEAATQEWFTPAAHRHLEQLYTPVGEDASNHIANALDVLVHDGYLEENDAGYRFPSRLLKDWFSARFNENYIPLGQQRGNHD